MHRAIASLLVLDRLVKYYSRTNRNSWYQYFSQKSFDVQYINIHAPTAASTRTSNVLVRFGACGVLQSWRTWQSALYLYHSIIASKMDSNSLEEPLVSEHNDELALIEAPGNEIVQHDEGQHQERALQQVDQTAFVRLLTLSTVCLTSTQNVQVRRSTLGTILAACIGLVLAYKTGLIEFFHHSGHGPSPSPSADRSDLIIECVDKLTNSIDWSSNPSTRTVVNWFLSGPGKHVVPPPTLKGCTRSADFAILFSILVIRESLNITTASWYDANKPVATSSDICKWHRIGCDDNDNIVSLHLSNGELAGTLPTELGLLRHAKRIELYKNYDIVGTIPSELGELSNLEFLYLHETGVTGTIPSSLGKLSSLRELFLDDTKISGSMPEDVCSLRGRDLLALHADCGGTDPPLFCDKTCCTNCYDHHRNHTSAHTSSTRSSDAETQAYATTRIDHDSLEDIKLCADNGASPEQCNMTVMSTSERCVYCTRPNDPEEESACMTPTMAADILRNFTDMECAW